MMRLSINFYT